MRKSSKTHIKSNFSEMMASTFKKKALIIAVTQILPCESRATCAFVFFCVIACTCLCTSLTCKRVHQHSGCPCMCVCVSPRLDKACYSLAVPPCHRRGLSVSASVWSISRGPVVVSGQQWIWLSLTPLSLSLSVSLSLSSLPLSHFSSSFSLAPIHPFLWLWDSRDAGSEASL